MPSDPLAMSDLEPANIDKAIEIKSRGKVKPPNEIDIKREERLGKKEERIASRATQGPSFAPEPVDVSALLDRINAYKERFAHLKSRNKLSAKSSVEEIEDELHYIELQLGSKKDGSVGVLLFTGGMTGLEVFTRDVYNPLSLNLTGLGSIAKDNITEFQDVIDELVIKYSSGLYMQPEYRLVLAVGALVVTVHSANSGDARVGEALKKMSQPVKAPAGADKM